MSRSAASTRPQMSALKIVTSGMAMTLSSSRVGRTSTAYLLLVLAPTLASATSLERAFGSEMSGGISEVWVEGLRIVNSGHGIRIKTAPGRGEYVKNVYVADVSMDNVSIAIRITGNYGEHPDDK